VARIDRITDARERLDAGSQILHLDYGITFSDLRLCGTLEVRWFCRIQEGKE
jgi:hypothetical protein